VTRPVYLDNGNYYTDVFFSYSRKIYNDRIDLKILDILQEDNQVTNLGRVVMLAPPNQGSELVDRMRNGWFYRFFTGPAGQQLGTDPDSVPKRLGPANFDLGIIAGDRSYNPFFSARLPGPDDGKVSVASTQLEGMKDFLVVHYSHTWLPGKRDVVKATIRFLAQNSFAEMP